MREFKNMKLLQIGIVFLIVVVCTTIESWGQEAHPSFKGAKKARIIIKEDYGEAKKVSLASDIIELTSGLLRHAGVEVVTKPVKTDFTIDVEVKGKGLGDYYAFIPIADVEGTYHYSGAAVKIVVLFEAKDGYKIKEKAEGREEPSYSISEGTYLTPNDAPFWKASEGPVIESLGKLLHKSFGVTTPLISALTSALKDEDSGVRQTAAEVLGEIKDNRAVEPLISSLKDEDSYVREAAVEALEKINPRWRETDEAKKAVPEFISSLKDKDWSVRWAAAYALGEIKDSRAVEPLIYSLKDEDSHVRWKADRALERITGQKFVEDQEKWQRWWEENKAKYSE